MSVPVELRDLQTTTSEFGWAYLLTVRPDATPHIVSLTPTWLTDEEAPDGGEPQGPVSGRQPGVPIGDVPINQPSASAGVRLVMVVSGGTARNATAGPAVTLCYPPLDPDGYSLIVDGKAVAIEAADLPAGVEVPDGKVLVEFVPTGAVLHRSAAPGSVNTG